MNWISCYEQLPKNGQAVIFRTDHEGVGCGRFSTADSNEGVFFAMTGNYKIIGWNFRPKREHSEVHEWQPLPE